MAIEMNVIGRPSNIGGAEQIGQLCQHRQVIILGENDRKPDGHWPGKEAPRLWPAAWRPLWVGPCMWPFRRREPKTCATGCGSLLATGRTWISPPSVRRSSAPSSRPTCFYWLCLRIGAAVRRSRLSAGSMVRGPAIHSDQLMLENSAARTQFAKAVVKVEHAANVSDLKRQLLAIKVPPKRMPGQGSRLPSSVAPSAAALGVPGKGRLAGKPEVFLPGGPMPITESAHSPGDPAVQGRQALHSWRCMVTVVKDDKRRPSWRPSSQPALPAFHSGKADEVCQCEGGVRSPGGHLHGAGRQTYSELRSISGASPAHKAAESMSGIDRTGWQAFRSAATTAILES